MDNTEWAYFAYPLQMSRNILGISWLNGRFRAVAMDGRAVAASWSCHTLVHDELEFASALAEAIGETGFTGSRLVMVLDHRSLLFHVQDTPPAKDKVIDQILQRTVERSQFLEQKAAWSQLKLPPIKGRQRFLLALFPESLLRRLTEICGSQGLELFGVFPLVSVLDDALRTLAIPHEESVLIAADIGGGLHLVVGKGDGTVLFCRTIVTESNLPQTSTQGPTPVQRAIQEINRTLHFAQQQFGSNVTRMFVMGNDSFTALKDQAIRPGLAIHPSPFPEDPLYYACHATALSASHKLNLISSLPRAPKGRRQVAALAIVALFCASLTATALVELTVRARERAAAAYARKLAAQEQIYSSARRLQHDAARARAFAQVVGSTNEPLVPELFARYLAAAVPDAIRLTQFNVSRAASGWNCRLEGVAREQPSGFIAQMEAFDRELQTNVFKLHITDSTYQRLVHGGESGTRAGARGDERPYSVTGNIE